MRLFKMGEMIHGFSWNFISQAYKVFFSSLVLIILARLISVEEFGIIGMSAVFVLFFNTLLNIGFESSIVYSKSFKDNHLLSLLLVNILLGFIICGIGFLIAPLLSDFYNNDEIQIIFRALVLSVLFSSLGVVSKGYLQKNLKFKRIAIIDAFSITVSGIIAVVLAFENYGYWALVMQQLITVGLTSLGYFISTFNKIFKELSFSLKIIKEHLSFGYNVLIFNVINFIAQQLDVLVIGKLLGESEVGIYFLAFNIILKPLTIIIQAFNKTIYPILTKLKEELISQKYIDYSSAFFFFLAPFIVYVIALSQIIIPIILTNEWEGTLFLIIVFGYQAVRTIIASPSGLIFLVKGKPKLQWKFSMFISVPLRFIGITLGYLISKSALGIALGINIFATIEMIIGFVITFKLIEITFKQYFMVFRKFLFQLLVLTLSFVIINYIGNDIYKVVLDSLCFITFIYININFFKNKLRKFSDL